MIGNECMGTIGSQCILSSNKGTRLKKITIKLWMMLEHLKYVFACAALLWLSAVEWKATHHGVLYASVLDDYGMQAGYYEWEFFLLGAHACANHLLYIYSPQVLAYNTTCKPEDTNDMYSNKHLHTGRRLRHPRGALHRAGLCTARALLVLKMKIVVIAYFRACATDRNHGLQIKQGKGCLYPFGTCTGASETHAFAHFTFTQKS